MIADSEPVAKRIRVVDVGPVVAIPTKPLQQQQQQQQQGGVHVLYEQLLRHVFGFLDSTCHTQVALVCREWQTFRLPGSCRLAATDLARLAADLDSADAASQHVAARAIRTAVSHQLLAPLQRVMDAGLGPRLVRALSSPSVDLQSEASWALLNLSCGSRSHTRALLDVPGTCEALVALLRSTDLNVATNAAWALANLMADWPARLVQAGTVEALLAVCDDAGKRPAAMMREVTRALWILCCPKPSCAGSPWSPPVALTADQLVAITAALARLLPVIKDQEGRWSCLLALAGTGRSLANDPEASDRRLAVLVDTGCLVEVVKTLDLKRFRTATVITALDTICDLTAVSVIEAQALVSAGALDALCRLIMDAAGSVKADLIREHACWALTNLLEDHLAAQATVDACLTMAAELMPVLVSLARGPMDRRASREAALCLAGLAARARTARDMAVLRGHGVLEVVCQALQALVQLGSQHQQIGSMVLCSLERCLQHEDETTQAALLHGDHGDIRDQAAAGCGYPCATAVSRVLDMGKLAAQAKQLGVSFEPVLIESVMRLIGEEPPAAATASGTGAAAV